MIWPMICWASEFELLLTEHLGLVTLGCMSQVVAVICPDRSTVPVLRDSPVIKSKQTRELMKRRH